jgi:o-succinylbenzoate---CoA ligase
MAAIQCMVHEAGRVSRSRPAFLGHDIRVGYGELDLMVSATALLLRAAGIGAGRRVALYMENGWALATLIYALIRVGAVPCPLSTRYPVQGVRQQLDAICCDTLIARVREESRATLAGILCLDPDGLVSLELTSGQLDDTFHIPLAQPAVILFTSGSSAAPKAVQLSYGNLYYSALGANMNIRLGPEDCWLLSLPLYHVGGLGILFRCLGSGAAVALMNQGERLEQALSTFPVTHLSVVPTQLQQLLAADLPAEVVRRLKAVVLGGSDVAPELMEAARQRGFPVIRSYGLSEMASQVTAGDRYDPPSRWTTSGRVLRHRELQVAADGEILVRGATLFSGYIEGDRCVRPVDADGWFATGDIGYCDADGYLTVTGRKDLMFISGGENVHPEEIERVLLQIPGIRQAVVRPVPDTRFGHRPVAFLDRAADLDDASIIARLRQTLPAFKVPDQLYPWPDTSHPQGLKVARADFHVPAPE